MEIYVLNVGVCLELVGFYNGIFGVECIEIWLYFCE